MKYPLLFAALLCVAAAPATRPATQPAGGTTGGPEVSFALVKADEYDAIFVHRGGGFFPGVIDETVEGDWVYVGRSLVEKEKRWIGWVYNRRTKQTVGMEEHKELQKLIPHPKRSGLHPKGDR